MFEPRVLVEGIGINHWFYEVGPNGPWKHMQFTGLKDKNGKEIYEGDVVNWGGDKHAVIFRDGAFGYPIIDRKAKTEEFFCMPQAKANHVEVIGNVYEDPELLG